MIYIKEPILKTLNEFFKDSNLKNDSINDLADKLTNSISSVLCNDYNNPHCAICGEKLNQKDRLYVISNLKIFNFTCLKHREHENHFNIVPVKIKLGYLNPSTETK